MCRKLVTYQLTFIVDTVIYYFIIVSDQLFTIKQLKIKYCVPVKVHKNSVLLSQSDCRVPEPFYSRAIISCSIRVCSQEELAKQ